MTAIEIERYESPYSKNNLHSSISSSPVVAAGGGCCCSSCCCCCTSSFVIPEALILSTLTKRSQLTKREIFKQYLVIYRIGFAIIWVVGLIISLKGGSSGGLIPLIVIGILGVLGALIVNPLVVGSLCREAKDSVENKQPFGLFVFLIGLLTIGFYSGTILPILFQHI